MLVEHQSSLDRRMSARLANYRQALSHAYAKAQCLRPPVVAVGCGHRSAVATKLGRLGPLQRPQAMMSHSIPVVHPDALSDEVLAGKPWLAPMMRLYSHQARQGDILGYWQDRLVQGSLKQVWLEEPGCEYVESLLQYGVSALGASDVAWLEAQLETMCSQGVNVMMTMARHLEMRGRSEGWTEGRAEGRAEGRSEGECDMRISIVKRMLEARLPVSVILSCVQMDRDQLKTLELQLRKEASLLDS